LVPFHGGVPRRPAGRALSAKAAPPIEAGEIEVTARVTISYRLLPGAAGPDPEESAQRENRDAEENSDTSDT
jgi:hypothetical protein